MADVSMRILLQANDAASGVIRGVGNALSSLPGPMGAIAGVGLAVGAAVVGIGVASVQAASQFQTAMLANEAHAGLVASQVGNVTNALMQMGPAVGQGPTQLAQALYPILSGFSGITNQTAKTKVSLTELGDAAKSVAGSTTNVSVAAQAGTAAFNSLGLGSNNASQNISRMNTLYDQMNSTISAGNLTWATYGTVAGQVATSIKGTSIRWTEANAALATFTAQGMSAQKATTYLSNMYSQMDLKTDKLASNAKKLGLSFDEQKFKTMSLAGQMGYLKQITGGNQSEVLKLMNNNSVAAKSYAMLQQGMSTYGSDLQSITKSQGATNQAFAISSQGLGFAMQRVSASVQVLMIDIGAKLLPVLTKTAASIIPLITNFSNWLVKSGALNQAASILANGISGLVAIITHMVSIGSSVVSFFQHNQTAMIALKSVLAGVATAIAIALVSAFIAWSIAAGAAALATLAATWPLIAIGALVAVVVFAIVMAVTHWGAISKWIEGVWHTVCSAIGSAFSALGSFLHGILTNIANFFVSIWNAIKAGLAAAWSWIQSAAKAAFTALIMIIIGPIGDLVVLIITHWTQIQAFLSSTWSAIQSMASSAWNNLTSTISSIVSNLVSNVINFFSQLPGRATSAVSGLAGQLAGFFGGLAGQALSWGADIIQNIASGILGSIGSVISAVGSVASAITSHLHFSLPEEGPLAQADQWMPDMMELFASGIRNGAPLIQGAMGTGLLSPITTAASGMAGSDSGVLADQLSFTHAPTSISSGKKAPVKTAAEKKREAAQLKTAEKTTGNEFKAIDAEIKAIQKREAEKIKNNQKVYALEIKHEEAAYNGHIKAVQEREKHLKGTAKRAAENEIKGLRQQERERTKSLRSQEKGSTTNDRKAFEAKIKTDKNKEKQLKQEIHLQLTINATKLDAAEVDRVAELAIKAFGDKIRSQFGNI